MFFDFLGLGQSPCLTFGAGELRLEGMKERILALLSAREYHPLDQSEMARALSLNSHERAEFRDVLHQLEDERSIVRLKKAKYALKEASKGLVEGKVKILRSGRTLFIPHPSEVDALREEFNMEGRVEFPLPPHRMGSALDGDSVAVHIQREEPKRWGKYNKGKPALEQMDLKLRVEKITQRAREGCLGIYHDGGRYGIVFSDGAIGPERILVNEPPPPNLLIGQLVMIEPETWGDGRQEATGKIVEVLGWPDAPGMDLEIIVRKYNLRTTFPEEVIEELAGIPEEIPAEEWANREDWTKRLVVTIDPASARDFDDAINVVATPEGWELAVHIADVSHFVRAGGALDREAKWRGNSTYLPDRVLPMLPPRLCDDLCSLRAGVPRLTKLCLMKIDHHGVVQEVNLGNAIISNAQRLSYGEAMAMLKSDEGAEVGDMLREAWKLAHLLRKNRYAHGALDLDFPDVRVQLNEKGETTGISCEEYDESHQLIEEFMLAANESVAKTLKNNQIPTIYRIHEDPDPARLKEFASLARLYGQQPGDITQRAQLSKLLAAIKTSPDEQLLKLGLLRSLMRARYDIQPQGHFGLALANYCHFTSPIRRYADLVVHRSLDTLISTHRASASQASLAQTAEHISETERISSQAEKEAQMIKLFEWLELQSHAEKPECFRALISDAKPFGVLVEIPLLQIKGMLRCEQFAAEDWYFESAIPRWTSRQGGLLVAGHYIQVAPYRINCEKQWADFRMA